MIHKKMFEPQKLRQYVMGHTMICNILKSWLTALEECTAAGTYQLQIKHRTIMKQKKQQRIKNKNEAEHSDNLLLALDDSSYVKVWPTSPEKWV